MGYDNNKARLDKPIKLHDSNKGINMVTLEGLKQIHTNMIHELESFGAM